MSGFLFKVLVAALDTPLLYMATYALRRMLGLKFAEEITNVNLLIAAPEEEAA